MYVASCHTGCWPTIGSNLVFSVLPKDMWKEEMGIKPSPVISGRSPLPPATASTLHDIIP